jgi:hypothetical protein
MKTKFQFDAGVVQSSKQSREINDQGGQYESTPVSAFAKHFGQVTVTQNTIIEAPIARFNIADGAVRPGTTK